MIRRILLLILLCIFSSVYADMISRELLVKELDNLQQEEPFIIRNFSPFEMAHQTEAISYGCYRRGQAPGRQGPSKEDIRQDLEIISQYWELIRVYNADVDTERILEVIAENKLPLKMMLGVWLENEDNDPAKKEMNITNTLYSIKLAQRYPDIIKAVNVGNETQVFWSGHKVVTKDLIKYIRAVRKNTQLPVTTADDYNFWNKQESKAVALEIDFIVTHIYPLWNGKKLNESIAWLDSNYDIITELHPDKLVVLGEIGWATDYNPTKKGPGEQGTLIKGEVSLRAQESFLSELNAWSTQNGVITFWFEAFNEPWKGGGEASGPNEIEKNWGVYYEDRTPKKSFSNYLKHNAKTK
ncbi:MAG: glycosyl hydrolase family 17 [Candidatus Cloacimonetes bacterium]|nr:glycosyl hydrolase family 17 [Candidatus Cloacimonadota bacterium]